MVWWHCPAADEAFNQSIPCIWTLALEDNVHTPEQADSEVIYLHTVYKISLLRETVFRAFDRRRPQELYTHLEPNP